MSGVVKSRVASLKTHLLSICVCVCVCVCSGSVWEREGEGAKPSSDMQMAKIGEERVSSESNQIKSNCNSPIVQHERCLSV